MIEAIERRSDIDGCACVRCRDVDVAVVRRTVLDDARWSLRLLRRRPSVAALVVGLVALSIALDAVATGVGSPAWLPLPIGDALHAMIDATLVLLVFRGYVASVAASELTGENPTTGELLSHTVRRSPALAGTLLGLLTALAFVFGLALAVVSTAVFEYGLLDPSVFDGSTPTLLFGSIVAPIAFKLWIAPDICVVGGYGPLASLRASWRITAVHWRKMCLVLLGFVVTATAPWAVVTGVTAVGAQPLLELPGIGFLGTVGLWLSNAVWYCLGVQIYVRSVLDH